MSIILFGRLWQIILINEFPKCGASWLKSILDFLEFKKNNDSIIEAIENHSIIKMQKLEKVKDEKQRFVRKGIVGDWKNNFNRKLRNYSKKN